MVDDVGRAVTVTALDCLAPIVMRHDDSFHPQLVRDRFRQLRCVESAWVAFSFVHHEDALGFAEIDENVSKNQASYPNLTVVFCRIGFFGVFHRYSSSGCGEFLAVVGRTFTIAIIVFRS